jgi:hypothetical protein
MVLPASRSTLGRNVAVSVQLVVSQLSERPIDDQYTPSTEPVIADARCHDEWAVRVGVIAE